MNEVKRIRRHLLVSGRVQGVFYRESCKREALARGVAGHARNLENGTVEVVLEGVAPDVEAVVDWCRGGPSQARVDDVRVTPEEPHGLSGFSTV